MMCDVLSGVKVPSGYSSNIARCFSSDRNSGLKSHDYHVLMQQLLPVAIRNMGLPKQMADAIIELCDFFRGLCSKSNRKSDFQKLHTEIGPILCKLESKFPPAFLVVMIHLTVHLAQEPNVGEYSSIQPQSRTLTYLEMQSAHNHYLFNCDEVTPYIE